MPSITVSRPTALVLASALLALLVIVGQRLAQAGSAEGAAPDVVAPLEPVPETSGGAPPARDLVVVHVVGAVRRPGLLRLRDGSRVADAVARAGGTTRRADLTAVNLAAPLVDGSQILVPARATAAAASAPPAGALGGEAGDNAGTGFASGAGLKVSLSTASAEQLDELPGVGPVTAQKIIDHRAQHGPFRSVEELDAVSGIGPARIEQLRDLVTP